MGDERSCSRCGVAKPPAAFGRDARRPDGLRSECRECLRELQRERRRPGGAKPGALVLVPEFPVAPVALGEVLQGGAPTSRAPRAGSLVAEVERTFEKLEPPPGPADAAIVAALFRVAELLDDAAYGVDSVKDTGTLMPKYVQLLRELKATRASATAAAPAKAVGKLGRFGAGSA